MFPKISLIAVIAGVVLIFYRRPLTAGTSMQQPSVRVSTLPTTRRPPTRSGSTRCSMRKSGRGRPASRSDIAERAAPAVATGSGRETEWPQIGLGFGLGLALAFSLAAAARFVHVRQPAH